MRAFFPQFTYSNSLPGIRYDTNFENATEQQQIIESLNGVVEKQNEAIKQMRKELN